MNHTHFHELISQFVDRELRAEDERYLFVHLGACDECRRFLKSALVLQGDILGAKPIQTLSERPDRVARAPRMIWSRRVPMSVAAMLAIVALASAIVMSALWMRPKERIVETKQEVVYVPRLPAIQVIGFISHPSQEKK